MLRAAIAFFVIGVVSMVLGVYSIAGLSIEIGKLLLFVFVALSIISFVIGLVKGKKASILAVAFLLSAGTVIADDSVKGTAKEVTNDTKRAAKNASRTIKDKTCEMINGKMECAVKKVKHSIEKGADHVEDAID